MKFKTTKSEIKYNYINKIVKVGYCKLQYLLRNIEPVAYSSGIYGWSCDYYIFDNYGFCISTGYSPIGSNKFDDIVEKYEKKSRKILENYKKDYQARKKANDRLLKKFIDEILERGF